MKRSTLLTKDIGWAEGPRWHDDLLYFSDIYGDRTVQTVDANGERRVVVEVPNHPSGLGWTADGDLLIVSMDDNAIVRLPRGGGDLVLHSSLADLAVAVNDMFVLRDGTAFVGDNGFRFGEEAPRPGRIIRVGPDGSAAVVADGLALPNGLAATSDESALVVAETLGGRLTRFVIGEDRSLSGRELQFAGDELARSADIADLLDLEVFFTRPFAPDGICVDARDRVWIGNPFRDVIQCIDQSGEVVDEVQLSLGATAPAVGGEDGRTLFVATGVPTETFTGRTSRIESCVLTD